MTWYVSGLRVAVSRGDKVVDNYIIDLGSGENQMSELKLERANSQPKLPSRGTFSRSNWTVSIETEAFESFIQAKDRGHLGETICAFTHANSDHTRIKWH